MTTHTKLGTSAPAHKPSVLGPWDALELVFGKARAGEAHANSFPGDPGVNKHWGGTWARVLRKRLEDPTLNHYVSVSLFRPGKMGQASRTRDGWKGLYMVVLDDVGPAAKGPAAQVLAVLPPPTVRVETSPGNEQWWYVLDLPELDYGRADALLKRIKALKLGDGGALDLARYVRLPRSWNGKPKYNGGLGASVHVTHLDAGARFTVDELAQLVGAVLPQAGSIPTPPPSPPVDPQMLARDPMVGALNDLGWITAPTANGWGLDVVCPFVAEHTDQDQSGTAYKPGPGTEGHWSCMHDHCRTARVNAAGARVSRTWGDYYAAVDKALRAQGLPSMAEREGLGAIDPDDPAWDRWPGAQAGAGAGVCGGSPRSAFLAEFVFHRGEDAFHSLRTRSMVSRRAVNSIWGPVLRAELESAGPRGGVRVEPVDVWFFRQAEARVVDATTYWPGEDVVFRSPEDGSWLVNTYRPRLVPDPGRVISKSELGDWLALVKRVLGAEGARAVVWFLDWAAAVVSRPDLKLGWAVVVQGEQGIGKDMLLRPVVWGVGPDNYVAVTGAELGGAFTSYAERRLIQFSELKQTTRGSMSGHDQYNSFKWLVDTSAKTLWINPKYGRPYLVRNTAAVYVASNEEAPLALEDQDRRALVFVSDADPRVGAGGWDAARFGRLARWLDAGGGNELVTQWLQQRWARMGSRRRGALSGNAPRTRGRAKMLEAAGGVVLGWVRDKIEAGPSPVWPDLLTAGRVVDNVETARRQGGQGLPGWVRTPTADQAGRWLTRLGAVRVAGGEPVRTKVFGRSRLWAIRDQDRLVTLRPEELSHLVETTAELGAASDFNEDVTPQDGDNTPENPSGSAKKVVH